MEHAIRTMIHERLNKPSDRPAQQRWARHAIFELHQIGSSRLLLLLTICVQSLLLLVTYRDHLIPYTLLYKTLLLTTMLLVCALVLALLVVRLRSRKKEKNGGARVISDQSSAQRHEDVELLVKKTLLNMEIQRAIAQFTLSKSHDGYDPLSGNEALHRFSSIKRQTPCIFARQAVLWGCRDWDDRLSIEENAKCSIPMLIKFFKLGRHPDLLSPEHKGKHLDGFLFEIRGREHCYSPDACGLALNRLLSTLSEYDPNGMHCLQPRYRRLVGIASWHFYFANEPIFITTFFPGTPPNHPRHTFDAPQDSFFILLQPEFSFQLHGLGIDTPHTNWDRPQTARDRVRVAFRKAGMEYWIPDTIAYPTAEHMVKSIDAIGPESPKTIIKWWEMKIE